MLSSHNTQPISLQSQGELCDTIFFQGNGSSQTQILKYTGDKVVDASTGEKMWCTGKNNLLPIDIITKPFIGPEIADVNLKPFETYTAYLNPVNWIASGITYLSNQNNGFHFSGRYNPMVGTVAYHSLNLSQYNLGQENDVASFKSKYDTWYADPNRTENAIVMGVSRGTAPIFTGLSLHKFQHIRLVILEGAVDSINDVLAARVLNNVGYQTLANGLTSVINSGFSFFKKHNMMQYSPEGPAPINYVDQFPESIPVVFITSRTDKIVPRENTKRLAQKLADRGMNDVYLLELDDSSHPDYMFSNESDRNKYQNFLHAIYKKYHLHHIPKFAELGENLVEFCRLKPPEERCVNRPI